MGDGVWKTKPGLTPNAVTGIQSYRNAESYTMTEKLKAPMPYVGGKSDMAAAIWARLGDTPNYVEAFCGSSAVLLARPHDLAGKTETCNDIDSFVCNAYRAIQFDPEQTAYYCDWPVSECDLTSSHLWLKQQRPDLTERLFADPFYFDPMVAARWLWGAASWIGDGWCVADGPWINVDGRLVDRRVVGSEDEGVRRKMPLMSARGGDSSGTIHAGIQSYRASVPRKMPEVGPGGNGGVKRGRGVQAYRHHEGVPKQMPSVGSMKNIHGTGGDGSKAIQTMRVSSDALAAYFARLSDRLRRVRFLCGDWRRACKDSVTVNHGTTGVFLDPPYPQAEHDMGYHATEAGDVWYDAARWAIERGDDPRLRICIAGYTSDATDALFPESWERVRWEARGGYANQKADGRGRANAKRECLWFSPHCLDVAAEARQAFSQPIKVRESNYAGTLFDEVSE